MYIVNVTLYAYSVYYNINHGGECIYNLQLVGYFWFKNPSCGIVEVPVWSGGALASTSPPRQAAIALLSWWLTVFVVWGF